MLEAYEAFMKEKGNRPRSVEVTIRRLTTLFRLVLNYELADEAMAGYRSVKRLRVSGMPQLEGAVAAATALWMGRRASEMMDRQVRDLDRGGTVMNVPDAKTAAGIGAYDVPQQLQPYLRRLADGKAPTAKLFGAPANRHHLLRWVQRICRIVGLPVVSSHGLRGTWGSLARKNGAALEAVSRALGHASTAVTSAHYVQASAQNAARQQEVTDLLAAVPANAGNFGSKQVPNGSKGKQERGMRYLGR